MFEIQDFSDTWFQFPVVEQERESILIGWEIFKCFDTILNRGDISLRDGNIVL